ncbi:MAG: zinc-binding dehydrogenase [Planctomycetales bacterium]|nr:zinc-binding dehydrogenase [Planctomycetales bacterium]
MKAVQIVARGHAEFVEVPKPQVKPGHVLVRTSLLSLCGSDIHMLHYAPEAIYPCAPGTTGHEMVGIVEEVGQDVSGVQVGDRVLALAPGHLAMCEYYLAEMKYVIPLPPDLPLEELLQAQQLGTVIYACQRLPNLIGKNVVVIGQGSAGLWYNFQLRRMGAQRVIALDMEEYRLQLSKQYGATHTVNNSRQEPVEAVRSIIGGELADVVVEAAGEIDAINLTIDLVRKYGEILYFGLPRAQNFQFNYEDFFHKCCRANTIVGAAVEENQTSTRIALDLITSGVADAKPLITHHFPFADLLEAYETHRQRADGAVKIVIEMPTD